MTRCGFITGEGEQTFLEVDFPVDKKVYTFTDVNKEAIYALVHGTRARLPDLAGALRVGLQLKVPKDKIKKINENITKEVRGAPPPRNALEAIYRFSDILFGDVWPKSCLARTNIERLVFGERVFYFPFSGYLRGWLECENKRLCLEEKPKQAKSLIKKECKKCFETLQAQPYKHILLRAEAAALIHWAENGDEPLVIPPLKYRKLLLLLDADPLLANFLRGI